MPILAEDRPTLPEGQNTQTDMELLRCVDVSSSSFSQPQHQPGALAGTAAYGLQDGAGHHAAAPGSIPNGVGPRSQPTSGLHPLQVDVDGFTPSETSATSWNSYPNSSGVPRTTTEDSYASSGGGMPFAAALSHAESVQKQDLRSVLHEIVPSDTDTVTASPAPSGVIDRDTSFSGLSPQGTDPTTCAAALQQYLQQQHLQQQQGLPGLPSTGSPTNGLVSPKTVTFNNAANGISGQSTQPRPSLWDSIRGTTLKSAAPQGTTSQTQLSQLTSELNADNPSAQNGTKQVPITDHANHTVITIPSDMDDKVNTQQQQQVESDIEAGSATGSQRNSSGTGASLYGGPPALSNLNSGKPFLGRHASCAFEVLRANTDPRGYVQVPRKMLQTSK